MSPFEQLTSLRALWGAARRAARGKRRRAGVANILFNLEGTLLHLQHELRTERWSPGQPARHEVRDPKRRIITAAPFVDRIVHQALCAEIGPRLDRHLIAHSYACRPGKGTHAALRQATRWARNATYFLHLDVAKFFPSLDHDILLRMLERDIDCAKTLALCERIVRVGTPEAVRGYFPNDSLFAPLARGVGLPIGNLTSQHFANRYLSPIDHRIKDRLRVRAYLRYMDDMLLFGEDASALKAWGAEIEALCLAHRLRLHPWQVRRTREGVPWLGFRILPHELRVKRTSVNRAKARLARLSAEARHNGDPETFLRSLRATFAHWKHGTTWRLRAQVLRELGWLAPGATPASADEESGP